MMISQPKCFIRPTPDQVVARYSVFQWFIGSVLTAVLVASSVHPAHAQTFDRISAKKQYTDWVLRFATDFRTLLDAAETGSANTALVDKAFSHSVIPDSRMARMLREFADKPEMLRGNRGDPPVAGRAIIMLMALGNALPAGYGGPYYNEKPIPSDAGSFIWYLHVHTDETTSGVFRNTKVFDPYHLPPYGVMERKAYPFINFREVDGSLYATGLSAEFLDVVEALWHRQLY
jgi:hypothetical protein